MQTKNDKSSSKAEKIARDLSSRRVKISREKSATSYNEKLLKDVYMATGKFEVSECVRA